VLNDKRAQLECKMDGGTDASKLPPPSPSPASQGRGHPSCDEGCLLCVYHPREVLSTESNTRLPARHPRTYILVKLRL